MNMAKKATEWIIVAMLLLLTLLPTTAFAANSENAGLFRYEDTRRIRATLSLSGNIATCSGYVIPLDEQDCSITVTLYKKSGSDWEKVKSWSDSASNGAKASVSKTKAVSRGTYKVVSVGKVAGETSRATSTIETY